MDRLPALFALAGFVLVHLWAGRLRFLDVTPRSIWLSVAGGVSVAYVFVHVLPELSAGQEVVRRAVDFAAAFLEHHVYLVALAGLAVFYGLERLASASRHRRRQEGAQDRTSTPVFWIHIASFAAYNLLIGYLLVHREDQSVRGLAIYWFAMSLHFLVTDHGLREHHKEGYVARGRYVLAAALLAGWLFGLATQVSEALVAVLFAFLAGGVVLNVMKEELPEERQSRFWAFGAGAAGYAVVLLAV